MPIQSADEAAAVVRLLDEGKIEDREAAMADLRAFDSQSTPSAQQQVTDSVSWSNAGKAVVGLPEALASGVTGMAGIAGKLGYMYGQPIPATASLPGDADKVIEGRREMGDKIQQALTVEPVTENGKLAQDYLSRMIPIGKGIQWIRENWGNGAADAAEGATVFLAGPRAGGAAKARAGYESARATARKNLIEDKFPMTAGERGAETVGSVASTTDPYFPRTMLKRAEAVNEHLTEVALKKADLPNEVVLDAEARARIANQLGPEFDKFKTVAIKDPIGSVDAALLEIEARARLGKDPSTLGNVQHLRTLLKANGEIVGETWAPMRTDLVSRIDDIAAGDIVRVLDDGVRANAPPPMRPLIDKTRARYRNFKVLNEAVQGDPVGMLTPDTLWNTVQSNKMDGTPLYALGRDSSLIYSGHLGSTFAALPYSGVGAVSAVRGASKQNPGLVGSGISLLSGARLINNPRVAPIYMATKKGAKGASKASLKAGILNARTPEERKKAIMEFLDAAE